jgi:uncharacterized membrane protein YfcA
MILSILIILTIITSSISGVIGMGGGVLLLSLMTFVLPYQVIIPIHGATQLVSNSSRTYFLRQHINYKFIGYYILGAVVGVILATLWLKQFDLKQWPKIMIAILIFYTVLKPKKMPQLIIPNPLWIGVGAISGALSLLVGATGPFLAAFFVRDDLDKKEIVATKAFMQLFSHFLKIPAFLYLAFPYQDHLPTIIGMAIAAIIGTKLGVHLLHRINENVFRMIFKVVLFFSGVRILYLSIQS